MVKVFRNGLATGLVLQLAIGPVFFFIVNLAVQRTIIDGLAGALAVTIVDYLYITLAILGVGKVLENRSFQKVFGIVSSIILMIFGLMLVKNIIGGSVSNDVPIGSSHLISSFTSVFLLTISSPMTIVFFTGIFASKALEYHYTKNELRIFGFGTGLATLLFMGTSVLLFSLIREAIPIVLIQFLHLMVGGLLVGYGGIRLVKILHE